MPAGRPYAITKEKEKIIAELFWLAFTDAQVALFTDVDEKTIRRARAGEMFPAIKKAEVAREIAYRKRVWDGTGNWCGTAWFLERKYPQQFAKPELQLQINSTTNNTTNNTLVITAEVAATMKPRVKEAEVKVEKLYDALEGKRSKPVPENGDKQ